jgi:hypothetical protein
MAAKTIEGRLSALEKAVQAIQSVLGVLSKAIEELRRGDRPRRQPGSKAKLTHAQYLARKREVLAELRKKRWPPKPAGKAKAKKGSR